MTTPDPEANDHQLPILASHIYNDEYLRTYMKAYVRFSGVRLIRYGRYFSLFFLFAFLAIAKEVWDNHQFNPGLVINLFLFVFLCWIEDFLSVISIRQAKKLPIYGKRIDWAFDEEGYTNDMPGSKGETAYAILPRTALSKMGVHLFLNKHMSIFIPKDAFATPEGFARLSTILDGNPNHKNFK